MSAIEAASLVDALERTQDITWPTLTSRERQVADLIVRGYRMREIADRLLVSRKTVDTHRGRILTKTATSGNVALTRYAIRNGFVTSAAGDDAEAVRS